MSTQSNDEKPRVWYAVKRTRYSKSYQFYEPNKNNPETIKAIAPDGGNYEVFELIEKAYADFRERTAQSELSRVRAQNEVLKCALEMYAITNETFPEYGDVARQALQDAELLAKEMG